MNRHLPRLLLPPLAIVLASAACGGAVEPVSDPNAPPPTTLHSTSAPTTPFGTWDLVSLEKKDGSNATVYSLLEMDLRADGSVVARRCGKPYYEPGTVSVRCGDDASYDCFYGTVKRDGERWRVELPDLFDPNLRDQGVVDREDERLVVRYIVPAYPAGRFARVPDSEKHAAYATSTVGNCSGP